MIDTGRDAKNKLIPGRLFTGTPLKLSICAADIFNAPKFALETHDNVDFLGWRKIYQAVQLQ